MNNNWHIFAERQTHYSPDTLCGFVFSFSSLWDLSSLISFQSVSSVSRGSEILRDVSEISVWPPTLTCWPHFTWPCCNLSLAERAVRTEKFPLCFVSLVAALLLHHFSFLLSLKVILCFWKLHLWDSKVIKLILGALFGKSRAPSASFPSGTTFPTRAQERSASWSR